MTRLKELFAIVLVGLMPSLSFAQKPASDWNTLESLKPGAGIIVLTKNGREFQGEKRQSTEDTLFMTSKSSVQGRRTISLSRDEIGEVRKKKSRWLFPLIGMAVGIGVGLGIGQNYDRRGGDDPGLGKLVMAPLGGMIGFAGGAFVPRKARTIYVAP